MSVSAFHSASALLFDRQAGLRHNTRSALLNIGFGQVEAIQEIEELTGHTTDGDFDVVIVDTSSQDDNVNQLISQLRHNVIGKNPFVTVIITLWDSAPSHVHAAINSGADDLLMRPTSTNVIQDRLTSLVRHRKPFIVTSDYIGPERRSGLRSDSTTMPMVVPNALRAKVENSPEFEATPEAINMAMSAVNDRKISSNSERLLFLAAKLSVYEVAAEEQGAISELFVQMKAVNSDLAARIGGAERGPVSELCTALKNAVHVIELRDAMPTQRDHELLLQICRAIHKACQDARDSAAHHLTFSIWRQKFVKRAN